MDHFVSKCYNFTGSPQHQFSPKLVIKGFPQGEKPFQENPWWLLKVYDVKSRILAAFFKRKDFKSF